MADSKPIVSSSTCENSALSINDSNSKKLKSSFLYLSEADLLWKGDLMSLKSLLKMNYKLAADGHHLEGKQSNSVILNFV